jgi:protein-tyrosine phosphatase
MTTHPGDRIEIDEAPNLRNVGGWTTADGRRVRSGQVYRSAELNHLHAADLAAFGRLGIGVVYDLRTAAEIAAEPDSLPPGTQSVVRDGLADSADTAPAALQRIVTDPAYAEQVLSHGRAEQIFATAYRQIVALPSAIAAYHDLSAGLADPARRPALFH